MLMTREQRDKLTQFKLDVFEWFNKAVPVAMVALLAWVLLSVVGIQKEIIVVQAEIAATRLKIIEVETHLAEHRIEVKEDKVGNAVIHHVERQQKCNSCHGGSKGR